MTHRSVMAMHRVVTGRCVDDPVPGCAGRLDRTEGYRSWWHCRACGAHFRVEELVRANGWGRVRLLTKIRFPTGKLVEPGSN